MRGEKVIKISKREGQEGWRRGAKREREGRLEKMRAKSKGKEEDASKTVTNGGVCDWLYVERKPASYPAIHLRGSPATPAQQPRNPVTA